MSFTGLIFINGLVNSIILFYCNILSIVFITLFTEIHSKHRQFVACREPAVITGSGALSPSVSAHLE